MYLPSASAVRGAPSAVATLSIPVWHSAVPPSEKMKLSPCIMLSPLAGAKVSYVLPSARPSNVIAYEGTTFIVCVRVASTSVARALIAILSS